jgi:hypothetical protein
MTKDLRKSYFIEGFSHTASYVLVDADGNETYATSYSTDAKYVRIDITHTNNKGIFYSFIEGDQIFICFDDITTYGPFPIEKQSGAYIYMKAFNFGSVIGGIRRTNFQIFRPAVIDDALYYEVGHSEDVSGGSFTAIQATVEGDAVKLDLGNTFSAYRYSEMNQRFDDTWNYSLGRTFIITEIGQVYKPNFFKCSSPFIQGINVNGLSEFNIGDEDSVSFESGEIQKLQPTHKQATDGDVILAICNSDTYSIYIGEARVSSGDSSFLVASPQVIGDVRKQNSGYGTIHPESTHEEDGYVYTYDKLARSYWRYATNGIFPISEYKMVDYFEDQSELNTVDDIVVTGYDPFYKLIFVTFKNADTTVKKTAAFSILKDRWVGFYNFAPDGYAVGSNKLYSIVGGNIYKHDNDSDTGFNNFYGVTYNSEITESFNDAPDKPKEWKVVQLQVSPNMYSFVNANQVVGTDVLKVDITNRHGQATDIRYNEFEVDENMVYGEIRGDANATGGVLNGDPIYSNTIQAKTTFSGGSYKQLVMAKAGCEISRGHNL